MKIGLIKLVHEDLHPAPPGHPENPLRMNAALKVIEASDIADNIDFIPAPDGDTSALYGIHDKGYVEKVRGVSEKGGGFLDSDTYAGKNSFRAAMKMVTAGTGAADMVMNGDYQRIFIAGRPPGHHAEKHTGMGFCLFNNVAVTAEHLLTKYGIKRVAIIDWDVHHGNGTQNLFYERDDVFFVSLHQYPFYPGSGALEEKGKDRGEGFTMNIPMSDGAGDEDYYQAFEEKIIPALDEYGPEAILISAGFDARREDPLASVCLSDTAYEKMTGYLRKLADKHCGGKILSFFEGGYDPTANAQSLYAHLKEMMKS